MRNQKVSTLLIIYYSTALVLFGIFNIKYANPYIDLITIMGAIIVLISSITIAGFRFIERAYEMRSCYLKLDLLHKKVEMRKAEVNEKDLLSLMSEYKLILESVENHTDFDHLRLRYDNRGNKDFELPKLLPLDYVLYFFGLSWRFGLIIILTLIPLVTAYLVYFTK